MPYPTEIAVISLFALVMGSNDGAAIVAVNGAGRARGHQAFALALTAGVVATPFLVGWNVAATLTNGMVSLQSTGDRTVLLAVVASALAVVWVSAARGLPTSLTLALIGALVGASIGRGVGVRPSALATVLAVGLLAPIASAMLGWLVREILAIVPRVSMGQRGRGLLHLGAFTAQSLAYGANDGQKAFALLAISATPATRPSWGELVWIGGLFWVGTVSSVRAARLGLGRRLVPERSHLVLSAQVAASLSVGLSAIAAMPVSMTQASAAGLVGGTTSEARTRVRWDQVARLGQAWVLTLPAAVFLGALASLLTGRLM